jgi:hypothetical protein
MTTAVSLLTRGYFPRELPPPFTSQSFGALVAGGQQLLPAPANNARTKCVSHNLARPGSLRRPLKIPNPAHHLVLAREIEAQWAQLVGRCRAATLSASVPMVRRTILDRAVVPRLSHRVLSRLRARRFVGARYFLRTDINQFYPSLYTHSIPWALHGKAQAKAQMGRTLGDRIDRAFRNQQDGQTIGVPIGPDASLVVAELVLAAVDEELARLKPRGFRYVDDYEVAFSTLAEAEDMLATLQGLLANYELNLNPRKTQIIEGPIGYDERWVVELGRFQFRDRTPATQLNDAIAFFSRAFELAKEHPQAAVLRYEAIVAQRWMFPNSGWRTFQALLLAVAANDPGTLPVLVVLLSRHVIAGRLVNKTAVRRVLETIIERHAPLGHGSEVAWALWTAIQFEIDLPAGVATRVAAMEDDVVALLALDASGQGRFPANALDLTTWRGLVALPGALQDEHWLLAYESNRKQWLQCQAVAGDPFFSILEANQVSFYDPARRLVNSRGLLLRSPAGSWASATCSHSRSSRACVLGVHESYALSRRA